MNTAPPPGGNPPPEQYSGYPPGPSWRLVLPRKTYTPWITRVGAFLIDIIPSILILGTGWVAGEVALNCGVIRNDTPAFGYCGWAISTDGHFSATGRILLTVAAIFALASYGLALAYWIWNLGYRQGKTGSSIGKSVLKFKVVSDKTWQPIGFGQSVVRQIAHSIDFLACYVGFLWPLWDPQRQTLADKVTSTVCVPLNQQSAPPEPPSR